MGFLSNLLKNEAKKFVSDMVENVVDNVLNDADGKVTSNANTSVKRSIDEKGMRSRIEYVLKEEWSGYEIRRNVSASEFMAEEGARDYSYGIYQDGQPQAMLMVLNNRNHGRLKEICKSRNACDRMRIPYMNFYSHLPNDIEYISNRLKENVR